VDIMLLDTMLIQAKMINLGSVYQPLYETMELFYLKQKNFKKAHETLSGLQSVKDSIFESSKMDRIKKSELAYKFNRKQEKLIHENQLFEERIAVQKNELNFQYAISIVLIALILVALYSIVKHKSFNKEIQRQHNKTLSLHHELQQVYEESEAYYDQSILLDKGSQQVRIRNIIYLIVSGNNTSFYIYDEEEIKIIIEKNQSLNKSLQKLPNTRFVQINKSSAINIDKMKGQTSDGVIMKDHEELTVTETYKKEFKAILKKKK
jgi:DNA-binding LytR/AlgR family response regulator